MLSDCIWDYLNRVDNTVKDKLNSYLSNVLHAINLSFPEGIVSTRECDLKINGLMQIYRV